MIISTINIKKDAETIWRAITEKEQMKDWYFDIADFKLNPGAEFNFHEPGDEGKYHHHCIIKEIVPNKKLIHSWSYPDLSKGVSEVTWLLEEQNDMTTVTLQHKGLENLADAGPEVVPENFQKGWNGFMFKLKNYINGFRKKTYELTIHAPAEKVWQTLFNPETYQQWTSVFAEGSHYKGTLEIGSRIHFLDASGGGMYANVISCTPPRYILFQHMGTVVANEEQSITAETEKWSGAFEGYRLKEENGITLLKAEVDLTPESTHFFDSNFPKALQIIKDLSETN
ncbi:MAG: SRPBCC family protein [Ginsengibacter sp.]